MDSGTSEWSVPVELGELAPSPGNGQLIQELFETQAHRTPTAVAVMYEGRHVTYAELNCRANQLARYLLNRGVGPEPLVGICVERSIEMVIGLLGVLKAGGAYVPLDPNYPLERLQYMVADAAPQIVLTHDELRPLLPRTDAEVIALNALLPQISAHVGDDLPTAELGLTPESLVYVIYTSGSTGRPKGTAMPHRAMVNLMRWHGERFPDTAGTRVLQFAALSFDVAFQEIFSTLCGGGTLVLLQEWIRKDAAALNVLLQDQGVQRLFVPPLMLQSLAELCKSVSMPPPRGLRDVIVAGEQLRVSPEIRGFFQQLNGCRLHNHYGPTETHVVSTLTLSEDPALWPALPSIGRPISSTRIHVLDAQLRTVPAAVEGEIYIGGAAVARGYLRQPEQTESRFVRDPFSSDPRSRLYKTGDLGRWLQDGTLEYLGRNDDQVKIRGFRIELGEIEVHLARHPQVKEAAVVAREDFQGEKRLVGYITARQAKGPGVEELRAHLLASLPEYMVPSAFVTLERLPLTPSGKLDRRALPAPQLEAFVTRQHEPPQGAAEELLARIWQELLRVEPIGRQDRFFELGGHSLLIARMLERLRRAGYTIQARHVYETRTLAELARVLTRDVADTFEAPPNLIPPNCEAITPQMVPLVELQAQHIERIVRRVPGGAANIQDIYPLAPMQEGILFHHLLGGPGGDTYVLPILLFLSSKERVDKLVGALRTVIERHDVLRTAVLWEQLPQPVQVVWRRAELQVDEVRLDGERDCREQLEERMSPQLQRLELRQAPLMRLQVAHDVTGGCYYALLQLHHLACDHEGLETLLAEVMAHVEGKPNGLSEPHPYRIHVARSLERSRKQAADAFFRSRLGDLEEPTAPFGLLGVHGDSSRVEQARQPLASELALKVRALAKQRSLSVATLFHAAWALVVAGTSGRDDVVFGSLLSGRLHGAATPGGHPGLFINTLPLRLRLKDVTVDRLLRQTQQELAELLNHEQASLAEAQSCSAVPASLPLFSTLLNFLHSRPMPGTDGIELLEIKEWTNYPVALIVEDQGAGFTLIAQTERSIEPARMLGYLITALKSLVAAMESGADQPALSLCILPQAEYQRVVRSFNDTQVPYPREKTIHAVFEEQVQRDPQATAISYQEQRLTYADLNARVNRLARYLVDRGARVGSCIPILMPRSLQMVMAQLAVLKAGCVYVPLDPQLPRERQQFIIRDCGARLVLFEGTLPAGLGQETVQFLDWSGCVTQSQEFDTQNLSVGLQVPAPACVLYTSGSTGVPKGVVVPHHAVHRLVVNNEYAHFGPADCIAHSSNPAFDASTFEIWAALLNGARLLIVPQGQALEAGRLSELLTRERVSVLFQTTALFNQNAVMAPQLYQNLRYVLFGGEAADANAAREALRQGGFEHLLHMYGPTEATTFATWYPVVSVSEGDQTLPIGRPISNVQVYVLNQHLQPMPLGVAGEIYIGGAGVALGYLHRDALTAERFIVDPFSTDPEARLYKSGDLGRWRIDGSIEFLGRNDRQVKLRGLRIELGEIEAQLVKHSHVKESVVLAREDVAGHKRLVAYVTGRGPDGLDVEELRLHLKATLPEYMVPGAFVVLDQLPLTPNGKVDRKALPAPAERADSMGDYVAPRTELEKTLAGIWAELLRVERVGVQDNFFDLGGHSLLATRVMTHISDVLEIDLPLRALFEQPTVAGLSNSVVRELAAELAMETS